MLIRRGFTIVELLIVIVVIAILAAITVVMYNGLQVRAFDAQRTATVTDIQKRLELFYNQHGAYPSHSEMTGSAGVATLNVPITALSPPENPRAGVRMGWAVSVTGKPTPSQYQFAYITHLRADGSGAMCDNTTRCQAYDLSYITHDGHYADLPIMAMCAVDLCAT